MNRTSPAAGTNGAESESAAPRGARPRKLTPSRFVLFLLLSWLGVLGSAEVVLRLAGFAPSPAAQVPSHYDPFRAHDELIWELKPGWRGFELNGAPVTVNSLGLRGPEAERTPTASMKRILFLGDSVVFGHGLGEGSTLADQLQDQLNEQQTDYQIEVLNAGVPGYSTFQSELFFQLRGRELDPDLVLLGFCFNDVTERYLSLAKYGGPRIFMKNVDTSAAMSWPQRLWRQLAVREAFVSLRQNAAKRGENYRVERLWTDPDAPHIRQAWQDVFDEIDRLAQAVRGSGAKFAVVIFPYSVQLFENGPADGPQQVLAAHLESRDILYLDVLQPLQEGREPPEMYFVDDNHFSAVGALVVAGQIARLIQDRDLLSD